VRVRLRRGRAEVTGVRSPHSLLSAGARYGEESALWTPEDAAGFCRLYGLQAQLAARRERPEETR
ncbi:MAG: argininosuccinate synthase, partial [Planctomycetota bacterium]